MVYRTVGSWTIQESGELTHRNCDKGTRLLGRRIVCNNCLAVVPQAVRTLADEVQHLSGEVNMTIQEPVVEEKTTLEPSTFEESNDGAEFTPDPELTEALDDIEEEIEAEAEAQNEESEEEVVLEDEIPPVFGDEQIGTPIQTKRLNITF